MRISHRLMRPEDAAECAAIIAAHPVAGQRYGKQIGNLSAAWSRLVSCGAMRATVFHADDDPCAPICFVGTSVFVNDNFLQEMKGLPGAWIGPELLERILRNESPILSDHQLRVANSVGGLNLLVWEGCFAKRFENSSEIGGYTMNEFVEEHRGYLLKEIINTPMESVERLQWTIQTGGMLWNPVTSRYEDSFDRDPQEIISKPHVVGITRDLEFARRGSWTRSWVGLLFDYHPPHLGFSRAEQKLLLVALSGATDPDLAADLGISVSTVKNTWRSIYNRVASRWAEIIPDHSHAEPPASDRGKEKRRYLLAYLRNHPEELRPVSQKHLRVAKNSPGVRSDSMG